MNLIINYKRYFVISPITSLVVFVAIIISSCSLASVESSVSGQINQPNSQNKNLGREDLEILQGIENPCDFRSEKGLYEQPGSKRLYELKNAGYPKEISLNEAIEVFNGLAQCEEVGKAQPPLSVDEVIAAIRDYNCKKDSLDEKNLCAEFQKVAETGVMPKGALLDYRGGIGGYSISRGYDKYDIKTWEIYLYLRLDKYRNDLKNVPQFSHLIRLKYISSKPVEKFKY